MQIRIFYAWQLDSPANTNRYLIEAAARLAAERIKTGDDLVVEPIIDRDTQDVPGSPAIAQTILEKIDQCSLFLCDVTYVGKSTTRGHLTPNPNVLIELGYAAARKGWERVICVMNQEYGGPSKLPFDLHHRRWPIPYRLVPGASEGKITEECERLSENIEREIRTAITSGLLMHVLNPKDRRVAIRLRHTLGPFMGSLRMFLIGSGLEDAMLVFSQDHEDQADTSLPDPMLVEPIIQALTSHSFRTSSNIRQGESPLTWTQAFILLFEEMNEECNQILNRYADRDDTLVSLVESLGDSTRMLASMLRITLTAPDFVDLYDNGVPLVHVEHFRYFLRRVLKVLRVTKEFGANS